VVRWVQGGELGAGRGEVRAGWLGWCMVVKLVQGGEVGARG